MTLENRRMHDACDQSRPPHPQRAACWTPGDHIPPWPELAVGTPTQGERHSSQASQGLGGSLPEDGEASNDGAEGQGRLLAPTLTTVRSWPRGPTQRIVLSVQWNDGSVWGEQRARNAWHMRG